MSGVVEPPRTPSTTGLTCITEITLFASAIKHESGFLWVEFFLRLGNIMEALLWGAFRSHSAAIVPLMYFSGQQCVLFLKPVLILILLGKCSETVCAKKCAHFVCAYSFFPTPFFDLQNLFLPHPLVDFSYFSGYFWGLYICLQAFLLNISSCRGWVCIIAL